MHLLRYRLTSPDLSRISLDIILNSKEPVTLQQSTCSEGLESQAVLRDESNMNLI